MVGINTFYKMPRMIAEFLKLPLPEYYTGHCFRRSSATLLANTVANTLMMKRHGGWKSNSVVESVEDKKEIRNRILMGTCSTKNCQGFSLKMSLTRILSNVVEKCLKSAYLIFFNNVIPGYFNSDVCNFD
jgi:hypothetical protein